LQVNLWPVLVLLLALAIPSVGSSSAQSNDTQSSVNITADNVTNLVGNVTKNASSPFVNNTETSSVNTTNVVINEVELNPRGSDADHEWIELYNPANVDVNVSDFEIRTSFKSATIPLPSEAAIEANGTYVVELDGQMLSNTAESLVLANASGEIIDRTPSLVDRSDDDRTWQRIPDGNDEWQFAAGTRDELNDPGQQASATRSAGAGSAALCHGTAGCAEGTVTRIVDGDTLYVKVNSTIYKIDLALTRAPSSSEQGFIDSTSFTRNLCLGSNVLVDQDDKLLASNTSVIAVVYCESSNLNSELLDNGYAKLDASQCQTSEFASQSWAKEHGC
jgi:endonuclease YncB( thermonuclease family)